MRNRWLASARFFLPAETFFASNDDVIRSQARRTGFEKINRTNYTISREPHKRYKNNYLSDETPHRNCNPKRTQLFDKYIPKQNFFWRKRFAQFEQKNQVLKTWNQLKLTNASLVSLCSKNIVPKRITHKNVVANFKQLVNETITRSTLRICWKRTAFWRRSRCERTKRRLRSFSAYDMMIQSALRLCACAGSVNGKRHELFHLYSFVTRAAGGAKEMETWKQKLQSKNYSYQLAKKWQVRDWK